MVLLIACCNLANLLMGAAAARTHEIGAPGRSERTRPGRIRQALSESLLLAATGAVAGLVPRVGARWPR